MIVAPAITVYGLPDVLAALGEGLPVTLLSAHGAALSAGCGWWRALIELGRAQHAATPCRDILDCADAPGRAMAALRIGQSCLVLSPSVPAYGRVAAAAATVGATVLPQRPVSLDLAERGAHRGIRAWLTMTDAAHSANRSVMATSPTSGAEPP